MAADGRPRRWIGIVLAACLAIFVYNLVADRLTPYSSQATVQAYIVGIAPEVAGNVVEVAVIDNQVVEGGDLLFRIDPQPYEVAVREAEAAVDRAGQSIGASTGSVALTENATICSSYPSNLYARYCGSSKLMQQIPRGRSTRKREVMSSRSWMS